VKISEMNWSQVEAYLQRDDRAVLPLGSTEQHAGLSLSVDSILSERVGVEAAEPLGVPVFPVVAYGITPYFLAYPGTVSLRVETYARLVQDILDSLHRAGFRRILIVNGHGGNIATIQAAFYEIYSERRALGRPSIRCRLVNWWDNPGVQRLSKELYGVAEGSHATASEVAVTQYLFPDHIKTAELDPPIAPSGRFYDADDYRRRFPDGRIGSNPGLATPEHGKQFYDAAVAAIAETYAEFLAEV